MQKISRRLFLRNTATAGAAVAVAAPAVASEPASLTADERIAAAIEEIVAAMREKYPGARFWVSDTDNVETGTVIVLAAESAGDDAGTLEYHRGGVARR
jgi:hypothetical protein